MKHSKINWAGIVSLGRQLVGKPYVFGAEVNLKDRDPAHIKAIDCSELIEFLYYPTGLAMPDGSYNQAKMCKKLSGSELLIGDLGFKWMPETESIHHVGLYLGNSEVLEAKGKAWGTVVTSLDKYMASSHFAWWGRHRNIEDS